MLKTHEVQYTFPGYCSVKAKVGTSGASSHSVSCGDLKRCTLWSPPRPCAGCRQLPVGLFSPIHDHCSDQVMLRGGIVGRVRSVRGTNTAEANVQVINDSQQHRGYSSTSSSTCSSCEDSTEEGSYFTLPPTTSTSTISTGRRRRIPASSPTATSHPAAAAATSPAPAAPAIPVPPRQRRTFRADRVHGRSWFIDEKGELVMKGEEGEVVRGDSAAPDEHSRFRDFGDFGAGRRSGKGGGRRRRGGKR